jgi:hypothetical protein
MSLFSALLYPIFTQGIFYCTSSFC